jgi:hypothetical protein
MPSLKGMSKAIYSTGRFVAVTDQGAVFALDNAPTRDRAEKYRADVEAALSQHLGSPVHLVLIDVADAGRYEAAASSTAPRPPAAPAAPPVPAPPSVPTPPSAAAPVESAASDAAPVDDTTDDEDAGMIDVTELEDADVAVTGIDKLTKAFPGAVLVEGGEGST